MQLSLFRSKSHTTKVVPTTDLGLIRSLLKSKIPETALAGSLALFNEGPDLRITSPRLTKHGDFRAPHRSQPARVTVNGNLNPYAFLITLIHELAHYRVWLYHEHVKQTFRLRRPPRPYPHGKEWKNQFQRLMQPFLNLEIFPGDILLLLSDYMKNPRASSSADQKLAKAIQGCDPPGTTLRLEELPFDAVFSLHGKKTFRKKEKRRTRYRCICLTTNRIYLVSAGAPVIVVNRKS